MQATTQWRKVQERLEDDERYSRLEKIDRLDIFQVIISWPSVNFYCFVVHVQLYILYIAGVHTAPGERRGRAEADTKGTTLLFLVKNLAVLFFPTYR